MIEVPISQAWPITRVACSAFTVSPTKAPGATEHTSLRHTSTRVGARLPVAIRRAAARLGLSLSVSGDLPAFAADEWAAVLAAVPEVPVVREHLGSGTAPAGEPPPSPLRRRVLDLARYPNAHVKGHGPGEFAARASPATAPFPFVEPIPPFLEWAYDASGPQRMMWGSDYGLVSGREGYQRALRLTLERFAPGAGPTGGGSSGAPPWPSSPPHLSRRRGLLT